MLRVLVLVLLLFLVWRGTLLLLERAGVRGRPQVGSGRRATPGSGEELVRCAVCATRVPASRALGSVGRPLCSVACRDAGGDHPD